MTTAAALAAGLLVGRQIVDVDDHPTVDGIIITTRPLGRRSLRYVAVTRSECSDSLIVTELHEGCKTLAEVAARRWAVAEGRAS